MGSDLDIVETVCTKSQWLGDIPSSKLVLDRSIAGMFSIVMSAASPESERRVFYFCCRRFYEIGRYFIFGSTTVKLW